MSHLERRQREKEEIKQRILEAARKIAHKDGWNSLTIRKIADEIEYTPPIVYEHFAGKEELIQEIIYSGFNKMHSEFNELKKNETDPKEIIKILSLNHWDFAFNNKELYQLMFSLERPTPNDEMVANFKAIESTFLELAQEKEKMHELILNWMCLINGAISIVMKLSHFPHLEEQDPREIFSKMINRFIESI